jgi:hypothetical protein
MQEKLYKKTEESINKIINDGITTANLDHLYKLAKINHIAKEEECMNNYGRRPGYDSYGHDSYGEYGDNYGRRGYDMKYRGHDYLDRVYGEYGRYMDNHSRYGASDETDKSFHYMVKALEDFIKVLHEEADTPQQKQMLNETLQKSMR